jgi:glyceraldehyde-3-phosphate dehydrogenase (NADP+)
VTITEHLRSLFPTQAEVPAECRLPEPLHQRTILVNGELKPWKGDVSAVSSPVFVKTADGSLARVMLGSYPIAGVGEAQAALDAAVAAYDHGRGFWPTMRVAERINCVEEFTNRIIAKRREIVNLIMWEIGKTLADSQKEFDRTIDYIKATIDALKELDNSSSRFQIVDGTIGHIRRAPLGVVLCMGPYNYPLNETFTTLIPALIMGNVVLFKPPKFGTLLFYPLLEAFRASFPAGVINTVYGRGQDVVPHLMNTGAIDVLALIGSSRVADQLKKGHPKSNRLRAVLGLDAKNAAIVLPDADLALAVKECVAGALSFNGQRCTAIKMIFVHRAVAAPFLRALCEEVGKAKIGMPWEKGVTITPMPDPEKAEYLADCIRDALDQGAKIVNEGGGASCETLVHPTVVFPVARGMRLYREEQFGPVIPVAPFEDMQDVIDYVITSDHGQQVSIFGNDSRTIGSLVDLLVNQVCRVNINCQCQRGPDVFPFTGRKDSAEGTLSVSDALRAFSIRSMVAAKGTDSSRKLLDAIVLGHQSNFISTRFIL